MKGLLIHSMLKTMKTMNIINELPLLQTQPRLSLVPSRSPQYHAVSIAAANSAAAGSSVQFVHSNSPHVVNHQKRLRETNIDDNPRHLFSTSSSQSTVAFCTAVSDGIRISLRSRHDINNDGNGMIMSTMASANNNDKCNDSDVLINLTQTSSLAKISSSAIFILSHSEIVVRLVDIYGCILSILLTYNNYNGAKGVSLTPIKGYILNTLQNAHHVPYPGSTVEHCQVCFPSVYKVVFGCDPHLYCVDYTADLLGDNENDGMADSSDVINSGNAMGEIDGGNNGNIYTWSASHRITSDPFKPSTFTNILKEAVITLGMQQRETEMSMDEVLLPGVSAVTCLQSNDDNEEDEGRIVTLHSDGSLRLWTISSISAPHVRRIVLKTNDNRGYIDPPLSPNTWDSYDSILIHGRINNNGSNSDEYELGLYVQCLNEEPIIHIVHGGLGGYYDEMKSVGLPPTTNGDNNNNVMIRDILWNNEGLCVLTKRGDENSVVVYQRGNDGTTTMEGIVPQNKGWGVNSTGRKLIRWTVEEELERYFVPAQHDDDDRMLEGDDDQDDESITSRDETTVAEVEAAVDKAGLLSLLQPLGRPRPHATAVHRALLSLNLVNPAVETEATNISPADIVEAMRKWKNRDSFRSNETSLVVREENQEQAVVAVANSPEANSDSIYHLFASAKKENVVGQNNSRSSSLEESRMAVANLANQFSGINNLESAENKHLMRWISFLTEVRRQETILNDALCFASISPSCNLVVRSNMLSMVTFEESTNDAGRLLGNDVLMARLDELSLDMLEYAASDSELRRSLCRVESLLFASASRASCLIEGQSTNDTDNNDKMTSEIEKLGGSILNGLNSNLHERQLELIRVLSTMDVNFIEEWVYPVSSKSSSVNDSLALGLKTYANISNILRCGEEDTQNSAVTISTVQLESIRQLALARALLLLSTGKFSSGVGLRECLFCTALLWSVNQSSHQDRSYTVLEQHFAREAKALFPSNASNLAQYFIKDIFHFYSGASGAASPSTSSIVSSTREPRTTLRLVAPLVVFPFHGAPTSTNMIHAVAKCLVIEASFVAKSNPPSEISPESLWELASSLLMNVAHVDSVDDSSVKDVVEAMSGRIEVLQNHLHLMEYNHSVMSACCGITLSAVHDKISFITSNSDTLMNIQGDLFKLWLMAFDVSLMGNLWDEALAACLSTPLSENRDENFRRLVLSMVDTNSLGKLVDMSLTVIAKEFEEPPLDVCFDIFNAAVKIIEDTACQQSSSTPNTSEEVEVLLNKMSKYWGALYTLNASRGNWKQAAEAMDKCGKATSSLAMRHANLNKTTSMLIMDNASLSASACAQAINMIDKPSDRYILPNNKGKGILTEEDIESRAIRAIALRALFMDEFSPDSVDSILKATSRETIDMLARLGYYDYAIAVAKGLASKRKSCPGGVDLFDDSLKHILATYLVPAATKTSGGADVDIQSRSKIAQIRLSSSSCNVANPSTHAAVTVSTTNSKCFSSNKHCDEAIQADLAMNLLRQYTTVYSQTCHNLGLHVADAIFLTSEGTQDLPHWLKELCIFGVSFNCEQKTAAFASQKGKHTDADPAGLVRLLMNYHRYYEAADVFATVLSEGNKSLSPSSRLPEKGSIDFVPYDLVDALHHTITDILSTYSSSSDPVIHDQLIALGSIQKRLEKSLLQHFELLKLSEEGLTSARILAV